MSERVVYTIGILSVGVLTIIGIHKPIIGWLLLGVVSLLILLFLWVHIHAYTGIYLDGIKLRRLLSRKNRLTTLDVVKQKVSQGEGTIIIEAPTPGWNVIRLWWCPDNKLAENKFEFKKDAENFIHEACENYDKYISTEAGTAKLFDIFVITQRNKKYLTKHFGHSNFCFIPSALVWMKRQADKQKNDANSKSNQIDSCR